MLTATAAATSSNHYLQLLVTQRSEPGTVLISKGVILTDFLQTKMRCRHVRGLGQGQFTASCVLMSVLAEWCSLRTQFRGRGGPIVHAAEKEVTDDWKVALRSFDDVLN